MEEIDIIELLKRVKEGKAPQEIEINMFRYKINDYCKYFREGIDRGIYYLTDELDIFDMIKFDTKIKILDKPIIEELHKKYDVCNPKELKECVEDLGSKINEIIKHINKENKEWD